MRIDLNGASACNSGLHRHDVGRLQMIDQRHQRAFQRRGDALLVDAAARFEQQRRFRFDQRRQFVREPRAAPFGIEQRPQHVFVEEALEQPVREVAVQTIAVGRCPARAPAAGSRAYRST